MNFTRDGSWLIIFLINNIAYVLIILSLHIGLPVMYHQKNLLL